jgi:hypothetical protein
MSCGKPVNYIYAFILQHAVILKLNFIEDYGPLELRPL